MSTVDERVAPPASPPPPPRPGPGNRLVATARRGWRQLTSMRTALILLFALAVAAIPGSVFPQRSLGVEPVNTYLREHRQLGPWLDRLSFFDVYSSPWFAAIYLLLFVSLVGCLVPRLRTHGAALLRVPPDAPRRLDRLPISADLPATDGEDAEATAERLRALLRRRRFRTAVRRHDDGTVTVSGEKGYLKETGNLAFHFSLLGLLIGVALGSWYGWHGNRLLVTGPDNAFCTTLQQFDERGVGGRVSSADLPPYCLTLDRFTATFADNGQPRTYDAVMRYRETLDGPERVQRMSVNSPLRLPEANVYLLGHGYAPVLRYTDRYGQSQTTVAPFLPRDGMLTSDGVAMFPDVNINPATGRPDPGGQVGFAGVYLPTLPDDMMTNASVFPAERKPRLMIRAYAGDLGLDAGTPLSVYTLDRRQLDSGRLKQVGEQHVLRPGETWFLPDGSDVTFVGTQPWVTLSVRHDPGEPVMLGAAGLLIVGLLGSLMGKRRRVFFRVGAGGGINAGGLPRSDYPGFPAEFDEIVQAARPVAAETERRT